MFDSPDMDCMIFDTLEDVFQIGVQNDEKREN